MVGKLVSFYFFCHSALAAFSVFGSKTSAKKNKNKNKKSDRILVKIHGKNWKKKQIGGKSAGGGEDDQKRQKKKKKQTCHFVIHYVTSMHEKIYWN